jgi:SAM-dependent methyltransferase
MHAAYTGHQQAALGRAARLLRHRTSKRYLGSAYQKRLLRLYQHHIPPGRRVLELGCARGDLLAALRPSLGIGVDLSPDMVTAARDRHADDPSLHFVAADVHELTVDQLREAGVPDADQPLDVVVMSDLINELYDVQRVLQQLGPMVGPHTRLVLNTYSRLWEPPLRLAAKANLARPTLGLNWLAPDDVVNLMDLSSFEKLRHEREVLWPLGTPVIAPLCNRVLVKLWPFKHLALTNLFVARPKPVPPSRIAMEHHEELPGEPVVSVIVAARNEAGNIDQIIQRTPQMGAGTELIFVEGNSSDDTWPVIQQAVADRPDWGAGLRCMQQDGRGKGDAVRKGFAAATGGVLMILDADMTVPPEDLPRFYQAWRDGTGEFINGVRLVYPMQDQAMRFFNLLGNKAFSLAFSWLLGQPIKDTLCGTKVLSREDYQQVADNRAYFGDFDPFGDFDLLFGAAKLNRKIIDMPIRYQARTYGDTNIARWRSGVILLRMTMYAARRLKFV